MRSQRKEGGVGRPGTPTGVDEEIEEVEEGEEDSISNVWMDTGSGDFHDGTRGSTVAVVGVVSKKKNDVMVKEDI